MAEVFSPPRLTVRFARHRLRQGLSADINEPGQLSNRTFGLLKTTDRIALMTWIKKKKPKFIMLCPPCRMFSTLQSWNRRRGTPQWITDYTEAVSLLEFACEVMRVQMNAGRYFAFEHPWSASSWTLGCIREILARSSARCCRVDMCMHGLTALCGGCRNQRTSPLVS